jgi:hypothetical protein
MKKLIVVFVVFALAGTALFAQTADGISVGGWGRTVFSPLQVTVPDEGDTEIGSVANATMVEGRIIGKAEKIGFNAFFRWDGSTATTGDHAYIWVKPINVLTVAAGKFNGFDQLRGKIGGGSSNGLTGAAGVSGLIKGEDAIFQRFSSDSGAILLLEPIEGLTIGAVFNSPWGVDWAGAYDSINNAFKEPKGSYALDQDYKKFQIGAGYAIGNIGLLRAQLIRGDEAGTANANKIQAAFALTAVEGLTVDIGGTIPLKYTYNSIDYQNAIGVDVGAKFTAGDFSILGRVDVGLGATEGDLEKGLKLNGFVEPAYKIGTATIAADLALEFTGEDSGTGASNEGGLKVGAGAWVGLPMGNGTFIVGVMSTLPMEFEGDKQDLVVAVPISLQYSF